MSPSRSWHLARQPWRPAAKAGPGHLPWRLGLLASGRQLGWRQPRSPPDLRQAWDNNHVNFPKGSCLVFEIILEVGNYYLALKRRAEQQVLLRGIILDSWPVRASLVWYSFFMISGHHHHHHHHKRRIMAQELQTIWPTGTVLNQPRSPSKLFLLIWLGHWGPRDIIMFVQAIMKITRSSLGSWTSDGNVSPLAPFGPWRRNPRGHGKLSPCADSTQADVWNAGTVSLFIWYSRVQSRSN